MGAELNRQDIISDEALEAPLILAKNLEAAYQVIMKISKSSADLGIGTEVTKGLKDTEDQTKKLTAEQAELNKVAKQMAQINARNNEQYQEQIKKLNDLKKSMKEKTQLGEKDAKTLNAQNSSMKELNAALQKNKQAYEQLASAEKRESAEGKELLKVIQSQDEELKKLKESIGENQLKVGQYENATKNLKLELKAAKDEMAGIAATLGTDSEEFKNAAEKAGGLKNEIGDLEASMSAMSGSHLENVSGSFGLMADKLKALDFKGATSAGKQFLATSKSMTFKEATAGAKGFGKVMLDMGKQLLKNPYVLIAVITIAIGAAVIALKDKIPALTKVFDIMGKAMEFVVQIGKDFLDWMGLTTFAADEKAQAIADAAQKEVDARSKAADQEIAIAAAAGKETLALEIKKQEDIKREAGKGMAALFEQQKRHNGKLTPEQEKQWDDYVNIVADAQTEINVLNAAHLKKLEDDQKAAADKRKAAALKEAQDALKLTIFKNQLEEKRLKDIADNSQKEVDERIEASIELEAVQLQIAEDERKLALKTDGLTASGKKLIWAKYDAEVTAIAHEGAQTRADITKDFFVKENNLAAQALLKRRKAIAAHADDQQKILDDQEAKIKDRIITGQITREQGEKELQELLEKNAVLRIRVAIDEVEATIALYAVGTDERIALEQELYELTKKLRDAEVADVEAAEMTKMQKTEKTLADLQEIYAKYAQGISELTSAMTERRMAELQKQSDHNQELLASDLEAEDAATEHRLKTEKLTDAEKKQIEEASAERKKTLEEAAQKREEDIEKRRRKAARKQAITDKALSLVQTQINAIQAIVASSKIGYPQAIPFIAAAAALGAMQTAAIIAKPIPAAAKGITGHKGGLIIAGEKGQELVRLPGSRYALTDAVASVYDFPRGTDIIPHEETMKMLAANSLGVDSTRGTPADGMGRLEKKLDKINSTIKNKREWNLVGRVTGYTDNGTRAKYIEQLRNRS